MKAKRMYDNEIIRLAEDLLQTAVETICDLHATEAHVRDDGYLEYIVDILCEISEVRRKVAYLRRPDPAKECVRDCGCRGYALTADEYAKTRNGVIESIRNAIRCLGRDRWSFGERLAAVVVEAEHIRNSYSRAKE